MQIALHRRLHSEFVFIPSVIISSYPIISHLYLNDLHLDYSVMIYLFLQG